jgi:intron-binding protein aquarius
MQSLTYAEYRIIEAAPPKVGFDHPAFVEAEIALDVSRLAEAVRREWESLRQDDVVYLLALQSPADPSNPLNSHLVQGGVHEHGLRILRAAEVKQVLDENGRMIRDMQNNQANGHGSRPRLRRLIVRLDAVAYKADILSKADGKPDVYESINAIVRRKGRENNFKKILETIKTLALADVPIPVWLEEVFLGFGDPSGATYTRLENRIKTIDFKDTFLDWQHLLESFPGKVSL